MNYLNTHTLEKSFVRIMTQPPIFHSSYTVCHEVAKFREHYSAINDTVQITKTEDVLLFMVVVACSVPYSATKCNLRDRMLSDSFQWIWLRCLSFSWSSTRKSCVCFKQIIAAQTLSHFPWEVHSNKVWQGTSKQGAAWTYSNARVTLGKLASDSV